MGGIQKIGNSTRNTLPRRSRRVSEAPDARSHSINEGRAGRSRREYLSRARSNSTSNILRHRLTLHHVAAKIIGSELYAQVAEAALKLYTTAADYAHTRGVILADTKFEFGLITSATGKKELILIDELLTPDSSRYWPLASYAPGGPQPSFDKQYVRDWLVGTGFRKGLESGPEGHAGEGWEIIESVVKGTRERYAEAVDLLMK